MSKWRICIAEAALFTCFQLHMKKWDWNIAFHCFVLKGGLCPKKWSVKVDELEGEFKLFQTFSVNSSCFEDLLKGSYCLEKKKKVSLGE